MSLTGSSVAWVETSSPAFERVCSGCPREGKECASESEREHVTALLILMPDCRRRLSRCRLSRQTSAVAELQLLQQQNYPSPS